MEVEGRNDWGSSSGSVLVQIRGEPRFGSTLLEVNPFIGSLQTSCRVMATEAEGHPMRQRPGICQPSPASLGREKQNTHRLHSAWQAAAKRLCGALQPHGTLRLTGWGSTRLNISMRSGTIRHTWFWTYNNELSNKGIGGITPKQKLGTAA